MRSLTTYLALVATLFALAAGLLAAGSIVWTGDALASGDGDTVVWGN